MSGLWFPHSPFFPFLLKKSFISIPNLLEATLLALKIDIITWSRAHVRIRSIDIINGKGKLWHLRS